MKNKKGQINIAAAMGKALENNDNFYNTPDDDGKKKIKSSYKQMSVSIYESDKKNIKELMQLLVGGKNPIEIGEVNTSNVFRACLSLVCEGKGDLEDKIKAAYRNL